MTILSGMVKVDVTYRLGEMKGAGWDDVSSGGCHQATEPCRKCVMRTAEGVTIRNLWTGASMHFGRGSGVYVLNTWVISGAPGGMDFARQAK